MTTALPYLRFAPPPGLLVRAAAAFVALGSAIACGGGASPQAGAPGGGVPAMPVGIVTLGAKPVEQLGEFVGTIKSRRSTTVQPQAEGIITRIAVKSGDRVSPGTLILEIDPGPQRAALSVLEGIKAAREADATFAQQQASRAKAMLDAGAGSQQEYDQAAAQQKAAEAQLKAVEDQIRQQQAELAYYQVVAPTAGVIGDIPVREGDRVTKSTVLTTIDANAGLEVYVSVPVQEATKLKLGLPVRIVGDSGETLTSERVSFISPSVDDTTQTVLVKAPVSDTARFRTDQFVRVRIVWSTVPGLTVPVTAVNRINGQFFVFVAENGGRGLTAKQRAVTLGPVTGNEYVVLSGLKPGEQLIVSGLQKIGDGAPVQAMPSGPRGDAPGAAGRGGH
ncbi:MAG TPA: efflux RND transporter periplasmic adaptor subunit [Vicinamibacterales bacterium]|nr:efflux RND transporter periplasmic adaptor subunit [Vicinamibacterales bacterium]